MNRQGSRPGPCLRERRSRLPLRARARAKLMARVGEASSLQGPAWGGNIRLIAFKTEWGPLRKNLHTWTNRSTRLPFQLREACPPTGPRSAWSMAIELSGSRRLTSCPRSTSTASEPCPTHGINEPTMERTGEPSRCRLKTAARRGEGRRSGTAPESPGGFPPGARVARQPGTGCGGAMDRSVVPAVAGPGMSRRLWAVNASVIVGMVSMWLSMRVASTRNLMTRKTTGWLRRYGNLLPKLPMRAVSHLNTVTNSRNPSTPQSTSIAACPTSARMLRNPAGKSWAIPNVLLGNIHLDPIGKDKKPADRRIADTGVFTNLRRGRGTRSAGRRSQHHGHRSSPPRRPAHRGPSHRQRSQGRSTPNR